MGNICCTASSIKKIIAKPKEKPKEKPKKKSIPKAMKRLVWDTYIGAEIGSALCTCCNHVSIRQIEFHCGHVIAEIKGGKITVDNLRPICAQCNLSMRTTNMDDFKKMFVRTT